MHPGFVNVHQMLPMPAAVDPTRPHGRVARGRCIWCGASATLDLGPRLTVVRGTLHRWTARACEDCARGQAAVTYKGHLASCARCAPPDYCMDARALYALAHGQPDRLIRETWSAVPVTP